MIEQSSIIIYPPPNGRQSQRILKGLIQLPNTKINPDAALEIIEAASNFEVIDQVNTICEFIDHNYKSCRKLLLNRIQQEDLIFDKPPFLAAVFMLIFVQYSTHKGDIISQASQSMVQQREINGLTYCNPVELQDQISQNLVQTMDNHQLGSQLAEQSSKESEQHENHSNYPPVQGNQLQNNQNNQKDLQKKMQKLIRRNRGLIFQAIMPVLYHLGRKESYNQFQEKLKQYSLRKLKQIDLQILKNLFLKFKGNQQKLIFQPQLFLEIIQYLQSSQHQTSFEDYLPRIPTIDSIKQQQEIDQTIREDNLSRLGQFASQLLLIIAYYLDTKMDAKVQFYAKLGLRNYPNDYKLSYCLAIALKGIGELKKAEAIFTQLVKKYGDLKFVPMKDLAQVKSRLGKRSEARKYFKEAGEQLHKFCVEKKKQSKTSPEVRHPFNMNQIQQEISFGAAMDHFYAQNYKEAVSKLERFSQTSLFNQNDWNMKREVYLAISYFKLKKIPNCLSYLNRILNSLLANQISRLDPEEFLQFFKEIQSSREFQSHGNNQIHENLQKFITMAEDYLSEKAKQLLIFGQALYRRKYYEQAALIFKYIKNLNIEVDNPQKLAQMYKQSQLLSISTPKQIKQLKLSQLNQLCICLQKHPKRYQKLKFYIAEAYLQHKEGRLKANKLLKQKLEKTPSIPYIEMYLRSLKYSEPIDFQVEKIEQWLLGLPFKTLEKQEVLKQIQMMQILLGDIYKSQGKDKQAFECYYTRIDHQNSQQFIKNLLESCRKIGGYQQPCALFDKKKMCKLMENQLSLNRNENNWDYQSILVQHYYQLKKYMAQNKQCMLKQLRQVQQRYITIMKDSLQSHPTKQKAIRLANRCLEFESESNQLKFENQLRKSLKYLIECAYGGYKREEQAILQKVCQRYRVQNHEVMQVLENQMKLFSEITQKDRLLYFFCERDDQRAVSLFIELVQNLQKVEQNKRIRGKNTLNNALNILSKSIKQRSHLVILLLATLQERITLGPNIGQMMSCVLQQRKITDETEWVQALFSQLRSLSPTNQKYLLQHFGSNPNSTAVNKIYVKARKLINP